MEHAANLLRDTDLSVSAVAARISYPDTYCFSKRFRQHTGNSPTGLRRLTRGRKL